MKRGDVFTAAMISIALHAAVLVQSPAEGSVRRPAGIESKPPEFVVALLAVAPTQSAFAPPATLPASPPAPATKARATTELQAQLLPAVSSAPRDLPATMVDEARAVPAEPEQTASLQDLDTNGAAAVAALGQMQPDSPVADADPIRPIYPWRSRKLGQEGNVLVQVTYDDEGRLVHSEVARSSGYRLLDREAVEAVRRAPPRSSRRVELLEIAFELEE